MSSGAIIAGVLMRSFSGAANLPAPVVGCPVPYFGDPKRAFIATVGINPSISEFLDLNGDELRGEGRRLPTLSSLGLRDWAEATAIEIQSVDQACVSYFDRNPYRRWFDVLDELLATLGASYYAPARGACHVDVVPWATRPKWSALAPSVQRELIEQFQNSLAATVEHSTDRVLVLNGAQVVSCFHQRLGITLDSSVMDGWRLGRGASSVQGRAYRGFAQDIGDDRLERRVRVLGYNHNLQSSFGVTKRVRESIAQWLKSEIGQIE